MMFLFFGFVITKTIPADMYIVEEWICPDRIEMGMAERGGGEG